MKPDIDNTATPEEQWFWQKSLFTSIGEGAIATDEFGKITRINPRALDILGTSKKEMIGAWFPKIKCVKEDGTSCKPH